MRIDELCQDKYIYLDWNVVKNMINPRNDKKELDEENNLFFEEKI